MIAKKLMCAKYRFYLCEREVDTSINLGKLVAGRCMKNKQG